jgi:hypothetical protein
MDASERRDVEVEMEQVGWVVASRDLEEAVVVAAVRSPDPGPVRRPPSSCSRTRRRLNWDGVPPITAVPRPPRREDSLGPDLCRR